MVINGYALVIFSECGQYICACENIDDGVCDYYSAIYTNLIDARCDAMLWALGQNK